MKNFTLSTVRESLTIYDENGESQGEATWITSTNTVEILQYFRNPASTTIPIKSSLVETVTNFLNQ